MIITYFDRTDDFKVKTRECYMIIPIACDTQILIKSKGLEPIFLELKEVIYISIYNMEGADNEKIS